MVIFAGEISYCHFKNRQNHELVFGQPSTPLQLGNFETSRRVILDLKLRDYTALNITQEKAFQQIIYTSKATVNDARYKVSRIVKLVEIVEIVEIKVDCYFYFYYALVGLYSANFFS